MFKDTAGLPGIEKALNILTNELDRTLAQLGVLSIDRLERKHLRQE